MNGYENSYDKYLVENDNFFYDEQSSKKSIGLRQDTELFKEDDDVPGASIRVARKSDPEDWAIIVNGEEKLVLKGSRFTAKEREFLRTPPGILFVMDGFRSGWDSVAEFKRQLKEKV